MAYFWHDRQAIGEGGAVRTVGRNVITAAASRLTTSESARSPRRPAPRLGQAAPLNGREVFAQGVDFLNGGLPAEQQIGGRLLSSRRGPGRAAAAGPSRARKQDRTDRQAVIRLPSDMMRGCRHPVGIGQGMTGFDDPDTGKEAVCGRY